MAALSTRTADPTYTNYVAPGDHPDPGVLPLQHQGLWYVATTTGDAPDAFPIMTYGYKMCLNAISSECRSPDLVTWTTIGYIFPQGQVRGVA